MILVWLKMKFAICLISFGLYDENKRETTTFQMLCAVLTLQTSPHQACDKNISKEKGFFNINYYEPLLIKP